MKVKTLLEKLEGIDPNSEVFLLINNQKTGKYMEVDCDTFSVNYCPATETTLKVVRGQPKEEEEITVTLEGTIPNGKKIE